MIIPAQPSNLVTASVLSNLNSSSVFPIAARQIRSAAPAA